MWPPRELMLRLRYMIWLRRLTSVGMLPWKALLDKSRLAMELRLPIQGGIEPPRP
uniref:Uncharacterized protein n=1 Tax=Arundo donax TaxID=35708 RepID=A0A0A8ZLH9_ARUDO